MTRILLITENIIAEEDFLKQLHILGYEVFCTTNFLKKDRNSLSMQPFYQYFHGIIFGKTISCSECEAAIDYLSQISPRYIYFRVGRKDESPNISKRVPYYYLDNNFENTREQLSKGLSTNKQVNLNRKLGDIRDSIPNLSRIESKFISVLEKDLGMYVKRDDICKEIWTEPIDNWTSRYSQLSTIIKNVRQKLKLQKLDNMIIIETKWRQGYCLKYINTD